MPVIVPEETKTFIDEAFRNGEIRETGTSIVNILPPVSMFGGNRSEIKKSVIEKLKEL